MSLREVFDNLCDFTVQTVNGTVELCKQALYFKKSNKKKNSVVRAKKENEKPNNKNIGIRIIAEHYGLKAQLLKTMEECVELAAECNTLSKNSSNSYYAVIDEMVDVIIMAKQILYLLPADAEIIYKARYDYKIERQLKRIEGEKELENRNNE